MFNIGNWIFFNIFREINPKTKKFE